MTAPQDINQLFQQAENAYQQGEYRKALKLLASVLSQTGPHPGILHLSGLCSKGLGEIDQAIDSLVEAAKLTPQDVQIANNLGNCLLQAGKPEEALQQYDKALALQDNFADARLNRAITLHQLERFDDARIDFDQLQRENPDIARLWSARGAMELDSGELIAAEEAYDKALGIDANYPKALAGKAKVALESGKNNAIDLFEKARAANSDNRFMAIDLAYARLVAGDPDAASELRSAVEANPDWIEGQKSLASVIWESGDSENYTALFDKTVREHPENDELREALCSVYEGSDDIQNAYETALARPSAMPHNLTITLKTASYASQLGLQSDADELFSALPDDELDVSILKAKHAMRYEKFDDAEDILTKLRSEHPENIAVWAFSDLTWRQTKDHRHDWLHGQTGLFSADKLNLSQSELREIAAFLRQSHRTNAEPLNQSLRGGTQTKGHLLERPDPLIQKLRNALEEAVDAHWDKLPPADERHPLLRHRDLRPKLKGSWSVRLESEGFHVQHIHPQGLLSSACYLVIPDVPDKTDPHEGWLELGRSAPDFPWNIEPLDRIEPIVGRVALFPSTLFHGTRPFSAGERITVAFDIVCQNNKGGEKY